MDVPLADSISECCDSESSNRLALYAIRIRFDPFVCVTGQIPRNEARIPLERRGPQLQCPAHLQLPDVTPCSGETHEHTHHPRHVYPVAYRVRTCSLARDFASILPRDCLIFSRKCSRYVPLYVFITYFSALSSAAIDAP